MAYTTIIGLSAFVLALIADLTHAERLLRPTRQHANTTAGTATFAYQPPACGPDPFTDRRPRAGIRTEAPIASAPHTNQMSLGAVFALTVSAAGVNLPELTRLGRLMQPRLLLAYTTAVIGAAFADVS